MNETCKNVLSCAFQIALLTASVYGIYRYDEHVEAVAFEDGRKSCQAGIDQLWNPYHMWGNKAWYRGWLEAKLQEKSK